MARHTVKSCEKAVANAQFFNFLVWHLFNRQFRKRWRRPQISTFCGDVRLIRQIHALIRHWLLPYKSFVPAKLQDLGPSPSFTKSSIVAFFFSKGGLYAIFWVCKTRKSNLAHVQWKCNLTLWMLQNSNVNKHFGIRRAVGFSPTSTTLSCLFQAAAFIQVQLICNLSLENVWLLIKCGFYSSAAYLQLEFGECMASNQVRFLYMALPKHWLKFEPHFRCWLEQS